MIAIIPLSKGAHCRAFSLKRNSFFGGMVASVPLSGIDTKNNCIGMLFWHCQRFQEAG
jgi:hypothetical protein